MGQQVVFQADQKHVREFQALAGVQTHEHHCVPLEFALLVVAARFVAVEEGDLFQKAGQARRGFPFFVGGHGVDYLGDVVGPLSASLWIFGGAVDFFFQGQVGQKFAGSIAELAELKAAPKSLYEQHKVGDGGPDLVP